MVSLSFHHKRLLSSAFIGLCALALLASCSSLIPAHVQQDHEIALDCTQFPHLVAKTKSTYQGNVGCLYAEIAESGNLSRLILNYAEQSFGLREIVLMPGMDNNIGYYSRDEGKVQVDDPSDIFSLLHELTHFVADEIFDNQISYIKRKEGTRGRLRREVFSLLWPHLEHDLVEMRREIDVASAHAIREAIYIKETSPSEHHDKISQEVLSIGYGMVNYPSEKKSAEAIARAVQSLAVGKNHPMVTQIFGPTLDYIEKYMRPALDQGPGESFLTIPQFRKAFTDIVLGLITELGPEDAFSQLYHFRKEVRYDGILLKDTEAAFVTAFERILEKFNSTLFLIHEKLGAFITENDALKKAFDHKLITLIKGSNACSLSVLHETLGILINQNDAMKQAFDQKLITLISDSDASSLTLYYKSVDKLINQNDTMKQDQEIMAGLSLFHLRFKILLLSDLYNRFGTLINQNDFIKQAFKQRFMTLLNDSDIGSLSFLYKELGTFINQNDFIKQEFEQNLLTLINDSNIISLSDLHERFGTFINQNDFMKQAFDQKIITLINNSNARSWSNLHKHLGSVIGADTTFQQAFGRARLRHGASDL